MKLFYKNKLGTVKATAEFDNNRITILKGSHISPMSTKCKMSSEALNARNDSKIVSKSLEVLCDVSFNSLSTAGQFVSGYIVNGKLLWKDSNGKKVFKEIKKEKK